MALSDTLASLRSDAGAPWVDRLATHGPMLVAGVLAILIAAQLAVVAWRFIPQPQDAGTAVPVVATAAPAVDVGAIIGAHLFGQYAAPAGDPSSAPATSMNLVLAGTIAGRNPEQGWAIIGESAQAARVYATGAALPGGAKLKSVYADRVVLDRNGQLESLMLPRLSGGSGPVPMAQAAPSPGQAPSLEESVRNLVAQDPNALSQVLRPQPVFAGGQQRGYRVYPGRDRRQFARLGLKPGDLVTAVNGMPLDDPNRGAEILRNVGVGDRVTLTLERQGQTQQLVVDAGKVVSGAAPEVSPNPDDE